MIDRVQDRCGRICGPIERDCYVNRRSQLNCIADLVINKTTGISMILDFALQEPDKNIMDEYIAECLTSAHELANWIKYLQMIKNLQDLSSLVLDADAGDKRSEIRYPMPEKFSDSVVIVLEGENTPPCSVINFSQSGVQMVGPVDIKIMQHVRGTVMNPRCSKGTPFAAQVAYCKTDGSVSYVGLRITEVHGAKSFNFFNDVYAAVIESELSGC